MGRVVSRDTLVEAAEEARRAGRRIVLTNGVFDLLHVGHARLLASCRTYGDLVVVGVNSDASVRTLGKGPNRPIVPEDDRAELVASLGAVDLVVLFDETTAISLVQAIRPNVYVKGGDYRLDLDDAGVSIEAGAGVPLIEVAAVRAGGGTVVLVPTVPGRSTTALAHALATSFPTDVTPKPEPLLRDAAEEDRSDRPRHGTPRARA